VILVAHAAPDHAANGGYAQISLKKSGKPSRWRGASGVSKTGMRDFRRLLGGPCGRHAAIGWMIGDERSLTPVAGPGCLIVFCCLDPKAQRDSDARTAGFGTNCCPMIGSRASVGPIVGRLSFLSANDMTSLSYWLFIGAGERIRTLDPNLGKVVLYP
jgi:hypothetical protein